MSNLQFAWCVLNIDRDKEEEREFIFKVIDVLQPWLDKELFAKIKEEEKIQAELTANESDLYIQELKDNGLTQSEIQHILRLERKNG